MRRRILDALTTLALLSILAGFGAGLALYLTDGPPPVVSHR